MTPADVGRALVAAPWWEWRAPLVCIDADGMRWLVYEGSGGLICGQGIGHSGYVGGWATSASIFLPGLRLDLDNDATAGVLVGMLPGSVTIERDPTTCSVVAFTGAGTVAGRGATLAEAAGRALLAVRSS